MPGTVLRVVTRLNRGGPLRQLCALVPALARRGFSGPVVHGVAEPGEPDGRVDLAALGADLRALPTLRRGLSPLRDLRALRALLDLARDARPDLIHTHLGKAGALGRWVGRRLRVPVVHTFHGHHFDAGGRGARWVRRAERWLGGWTARAIVLCERQRRDLVEVHRVLPAERVTVVPPGLNLARYRAQAAESVGPPGAAPQDPRPLLLWSGRCVRVKQPLAVLDVAERLRLPARLVMLGDGPLLGWVRRALKRRGLIGRVEALGAVAGTAGWVARARALFLTSLSEGTPLAVLEAFCLGVPVVVPTVGGLPDLVEHGRSGLWVPPGDPAALATALTRLVEDPALHARLSAGALSASTAYDGERLGERTAALYEEVLSGRART